MVSAIIKFYSINDRYLLFLINLFWAYDFFRLACSGSTSFKAEAWLNSATLLLQPHEGLLIKSDILRRK